VILNPPSAVARVIRKNIIGNPGPGSSWTLVMVNDAVAPPLHIHLRCPTPDNPSTAPDHASRWSVHLEFLIQKFYYYVIIIFDKFFLRLLKIIPVCPYRNELTTSGTSFKIFIFFFKKHNSNIIHYYIATHDTST